MSDQLKRLKELTPRLNGLVGSGGGNFVEYEMENGKGFGIGILNIADKIAVQRVYMPKGSTFPAHYHNQMEIVICYEGRYTLYLDGQEHDCLPGSVKYFLPNQPHSGLMLENTSIISISIPPAEGYPDAP